MIEEQISTQEYPKRANLEGKQPEAMKNDDIYEILRGEVSARDSYEQVLEKVTKDPESNRLREFMSDHENAIIFWKEQIKVSGEIPKETSGIWGTVIEGFMGVSKILGADAALMALKKGEEHGLSTYTEMLKSEKISPFQKNEIRNIFIPRQMRHVESISAILKMHQK
jgi:hypothetical protein